MKRIILLSLFLLMILTIRAQNTWTPPVPVTDSTSDNRNASILNELFSPPPVNDSAFMVWERSTDTSSSEIWCRNLQPMGTPFVLLAQQGVHFRNPVIGQGRNGDTLLYVFYETDINGNKDIYYIKYLADGSVSSPVPVRNTGANETGLKYSTNPPGIVWEEDGKIVYQTYCLPGCYTSPGDTIVLDRGDCHHPVLNADYCAWEKNTGNETHIYYSKYDNFTHQWSARVALIDSGVNTHLFIDNSIFPGGTLLWQSLSGGYWRIRGYDLSYPSVISPPDFEASNNTQPVYFFAPIVTDYPWPDNFTFYSFVSDTTGDTEIYLNENAGDQYYTNISDHPAGADIHPFFFYSSIYHAPVMTIFLTWESFQNGHWQIWMTSLDWLMGINDRLSSGISLQAYPNPSHGEVTFEYRLDERSQVSGQILSSSGSMVRSFPSSVKTPGKQYLQFDGKDNGGHSLSPGLYICVINLNNSILQKRFIIY